MNVMDNTTTILVIDDEQAICYAFDRFFAARGMQVTIAHTGRHALAALDKCEPDVVFLDLRLPDCDGLSLVPRLRAAAPDAPVVLMTAYGSLDTATRAADANVFDYLIKPVELSRAAALVEEIVAGRQIAADAQIGGVSGDDAADSPQFVGVSRPMQELFRKIGLLALTDCTVLITGETGTGKELAARTIHRHSPRHDEPFVAVNCAALPESLVESELFGYVKGTFTGAAADRAGRFEAANGGTLFLDEVGELPAATQVKLLRFLDLKTVERLGSVQSLHLDVRVLAATNRDLQTEVAAERFRSDLYYRLAVMHLHLPPLRDRTEDIAELANVFLREFLPTGETLPAFADETLRLMRLYSWPGNVRELRNAMQSIAVICRGGVVFPAHLPDNVSAHKPATSTQDIAVAEQRAAAYLSGLNLQTGSAADQALLPVERVLLRAAMERCDGNQSAAAEFLGIHRNTFRKKWRELCPGQSNGETLTE